MATALPTIASSPVTKHNCRLYCSCFAAIGALRSAAALAFCLAILPVLSTACTTGLVNFTIFTAHCCSPSTLRLRRVVFCLGRSLRAWSRMLAAIATWSGSDVSCALAPSSADNTPVVEGSV